MILPAELRTRLDDIRDLLHGGHPNTVLPVVGAGLSLPHLPGWTKLLEELIQQASSQNRAALTNALEAGRFLDVAAALEVDSSVQAAGIAATIRRHYARPRFPRPEIYDLVARLPVTHFATTNFDPWLKDAVSVRLGVSPRVFTPGDPAAWSDLGPNTSPMVLMLHGDADRPPTCVLSATAFRRLTHGTPAYRTGVSSIVGGRSLLFLGHSLRDPDLLVMLEVWSEAMAGPGAQAPRHFVLTTELDAVERTRLLNLGIQPIEFARRGDYALLPDVVRYLSADGSEAAHPRAVDSLSKARTPRAVAQEAGASRGVDDDWRQVNHVVDAFRFLLSGDPDKAEEKISSSLATFGDSAPLLNVKGLLLDRSGHGKASIDVSRDILTRFESRIGLAEQALHHWIVGSRDDAMARTVDALVEDPTNILAWLVRGNLLSADDPQRALANVDVILDVFVRFYQAWALRQRARILLRLDQPEQALQAVNASIELHPYSAYSYDTRSSCLLKFNRQADALVDLEKAMEMAPHWVEPRRMKAAILADALRHKEAIEAATAALALASDDALMLEIRAQSLRATGRARDADADFARAKQLTANSA